MVNTLCVLVAQLNACKRSGGIIKITRVFLPQSAVSAGVNFNNPVVGIVTVTVDKLLRFAFLVINFVYVAAHKVVFILYVAVTPVPRGKQRDILN